MATIGQQLLQPESGWKRYDDTDSNISYTSKFYKSTTFLNGRYGIATAVLAEKDNNEFIKFNFTGNRIRLYGAGYSGLNGENDIIIDGVIYHQNYRFSDNIIALSFELTNLTNKQHSVIIKSGTCARVYLDAIDIDENGELKPYESSISSIITWNPSDKGDLVTLQNNNLIAITKHSNIQNNCFVRSNKFKTQGKYYWEIKIIKTIGEKGFYFGIANEMFNIKEDTALNNNQIGYYQYNGALYPANVSYGESFYDDDIMGIALNLDDKIIKFSKNGQWYNDFTIPKWNKYYAFISNGMDINSEITTITNFGISEFKYPIPFGFKPFDDKEFKFLLKQNNNYYSINNNYIDLRNINNSKELNNVIDEYGYNDISILAKELNTKKIPTKLENNYYKSFDINLNDIKDSINLIEDDDKKYIEYVCDNYKISDKIKKINDGKFEVLMKE
ncbi:SPRY domain-containing protein [Clostridium botulinum]|uniref:SPRY domain-containing protein n=1 Tax=Clostridium botulinum TaxID=1491 RepID=UPI003DA67E69